MLHDNTILTAWEISEYEEQSRTNDWYWIIGFVAVVSIVLAIVLHDYLFALIVILGVILIFTYSNRKPQAVEVQVSTSGIKVGHVFHPYEDIQAFWITEEVKQLSAAPTALSNPNEASGEIITHHVLLATKSWYHPFMKILLPIDMNPFEMREFLLQYVEEAEITEPLGHKIAERLGF